MTNAEITQLVEQWWSSRSVRAAGAQGDWLVVVGRSTGCAVTETAGKPVKYSHKATIYLNRERRFRLNFTVGKHGIKVIDVGRYQTGLTINENENENKEETELWPPSTS